MATRSTTRPVGLSAFVLALAVVVVLFALGSNAAPDTAHAIVTVTPTSTVSKPDNDGSLSGVTDVWIGNQGSAELGIEGLPALVFFQCVVLTDHDASTNAVKTAAQCYWDIDLDDPTSWANLELTNSIAGEGASQTALEGPPPPPPYSLAAPAKGLGTYDPETDSMFTTLCISNIGGLAGPNVIVVMTINGASAALSAGSGPAATASGTVAIYDIQSSAACNALAPAGIPFFSGPDLFSRSSSATPLVQWRTDSSDLDGDVCTDAQELDKDARPKGCGDDPWNPGDSGTALDNVSGDYDILVTVVRGDVGTPGFYYSCLADLQHDTGDNSLVARVSCYIDAPTLTINPEFPTAQAACPPATAEKCGDGYAGGSPPRQPPPPVGGAKESGAACTNGTDDDADTVADDGCPAIYGDVNSKHTELTGVLDKGTNTIAVSGCFENTDGAAQLGSVFVRVKMDQHTGHGLAQIFSAQTLTNCTGGTPSGAGGIAPVDWVRQNDSSGDQINGSGSCNAAHPNNCGRDSDGDGCPNKQELLDTPNDGGLRDPANPNDYFEASNYVGFPNLNGYNSISEVLETVGQFFIDWPAAAYTPSTDRAGMGTSANAHNLGGPNYEQRVDDILAAVRQFFQNCGSGASRYKAGLPDVRDLGGVSSASLFVGSSRVDLQACKLEYSIVSPK